MILLLFMNMHELDYLKAAAVRECLIVHEQVCELMTADKIMECKMNVNIECTKEKP